MTEYVYVRGCIGEKNPAKTLRLDGAIPMFLPYAGTGGATPAAGLPLVGDGAGNFTAAPVSGQYLAVPAKYAPASAVILSTTSATLSAVSSANVSTGSFTAPPSGSVVVEVALLAEPPAAAIFAFALAAHGTVIPVTGSVITAEAAATTNLSPLTMKFLVSGLTAGQAYNFDLLFATASGTLSVAALGQSSATPTATAGAPVLMTVQAV